MRGSWEAILLLAYCINEVTLSLCCKTMILYTYVSKKIMVILPEYIILSYINLTLFYKIEHSVYYCFFGFLGEFKGNLVATHIN